MIVIGRTEGGAINVTIAGVNISVPDDPANRYRQLISEWEAEGNAIPPYVPPVQRPPNLQPDQFWFVLRLSGYEQPLRDWVAGLNDPDSPRYDPVAWASASAKLEFAAFFERYHPLVEAARQALDISEAELDALWEYGAS